MINDEIKRALLLSFYDTKKTLAENEKKINKINLINEASPRAQIFGEPIEFLKTFFRRVANEKPEDIYKNVERLGPSVRRDAELIGQKIIRGEANTLTEREISKILRAIEPKVMARVLLEKGSFATADVYQNVFLQGPLQNMMNPGNKSVLDIFKSSRESIKQMLKSRIRSLGTSTDWADDIINEWLNLWEQDLKKELSELSPNVFKKLVQDQTFEFNKTITKEDLFDPMRWTQSSPTLTIAPEEMELLLKNQNNPAFESFKQNIGISDVLPSDIDKLQKISKAYASETNPAIKDNLRAEVSQQLKVIMEKRVDDVKSFMSWLESLYTSPNLSAAEKEILEGLAKKIKDSDSLIQAYTAVASTVKPKSAWQKEIMTWKEAFNDSWDGIIMWTRGKSTFEFFDEVGDPVTWFKKIENDPNYLVKYGNRKSIFQRSFWTGSFRGIPKESKPQWQYLYAKYGSMRTLKGIYIKTLLFKMLKGHLIHGVFMTFIELINYSLNKEVSENCSKIIENMINKLLSYEKSKKITLSDEERAKVYEGTTDIPELKGLSLGDECKGVSMALALDYLHNKNGQYREKINGLFTKAGLSTFWGEYCEKLWDGWKSTAEIAINASPAGRIAHYILKFIANSRDLSVDDYINRLQEYDKQILENMDETARTAIEADNQQKPDTVYNQQINDTLNDRMIFTEEDTAEAKALIDSIKTEVKDVVDVVSTTLTVESLKQKYPCYWKPNVIDTNRGKDGIDIINDNEFVIYIVKDKRYNVTKKENGDWVFEDGTLFGCPEE